MTLRFAGICVLFAAVGAAQPSAVPVEDEPHHKTVFKNAYMKAFRVTLEPGKTSLMHIHAHDDAAVRLSNATVAADSPGQPLGPPEPVTPGFVTARDNEPKPTIHRVHNIGTTLFDVVDVEVLGRPPGPVAQPLSKPAAENPKMRVYRYELAPAASTSPHVHTRPYLLVAATDVNLRISSPDGQSVERPLKTGDMQWVETAITHSLTNQGAAIGILVEFELK